MNKWLISGRLTRDAEIITTQNGNACLKFEALAALNGDYAKIELTTNQAPFKIYEENDGVKYYHVLMPVRPGYVE